MTKGKAHKAIYTLSDGRSVEINCQCPIGKFHIDNSKYKKSHKEEGGK